MLTIIAIVVVVSYVAFAVKNYVEGEAQAKADRRNAARLMARRAEENEAIYARPARNAAAKAHEAWAAARAQERADERARSMRPYPGTRVMQRDGIVSLQEWSNQRFN